MVEVVELKLTMLWKSPSYIIYRQRRCGQRRRRSGEAKPHLIGWWGLPRRSPLASLIRGSPIWTVGVDCPEPGCKYLGGWAMARTGKPL
jgi:hypothetical protein